MSAAATSNRKRKIEEEPAARPAQGFLIGDRVRRTLDDVDIKAGAIGTVVSKFDDRLISQLVRWDGWLKDRESNIDCMELIHDGSKKAKVDGVFQVGDKVIRTADKTEPNAIDVAAGTRGVVHSHTKATWHMETMFVMWDGKTEPIESSVNRMKHAPPDEEEEEKAPALDDPPTATADEIKWLVASQEKYCDFELVQEHPIKLGFRCARVDLARLNSDFLATLLECADKEKLSRVTVPAGTFADFKTMDALFGVLISSWPPGSDVHVKVADTIHVLHAADSLGLYHKRDLSGIKAILLSKVGGPRSPPLTELFELGVRYHWKEMQEAAAKKLQAKSTGDIPDHILLKCAPFWRI